MIEEEIAAAQKRVKTDSYQMSIGEIVNMYKEGELIINPDFQRLFRWDIGQKSKFIESILLGIPIPPIFVFEQTDAKWELIDGLQRLSTLLEFMGLLRDAEIHAIVPPTALDGTKYLPSLSGAVWQTSPEIIDVAVADQKPLGTPLQLAIRRARLSVEILKRPSDNSTKYDLFQRLNAGGTTANAQELRNCIIIMVSPPYFQFLKSLANSEDFLTVLDATYDQLEKQRQMEYASRFLVHTHIHYEGNLDVEEFLDDSLIRLANDESQEFQQRSFSGTFKLLNQAFGRNALRRFQNGSPTGRVGLVALECVAAGIGSNYSEIQALPDPVTWVKERIVAMWQAPEIGSFYASGLRGTVRIQRTVPFGDNWFEP